MSPPLELSGGWHLLARTPVRSYDPRRQQPFLFETGDTLYFQPVREGECDRLRVAAEAGDFVAEIVRA